MGEFAARARFLFRTETGVVDAPTWRRHTAWLVGLGLALSLIWEVLSPYARHDLATSAFIAPMTILAYTYLLAYAFALILIAISYTMLSIKRLRDRGEPTGLAGLVPLALLVDGAGHFLRGKTPDVVSMWHVGALDVLLLALVAWTLADLGFGRGR